jgi:hypothetical protein
MRAALIAGVVVGSALHSEAQTKGVSDRATQAARSGDAQQFGVALAAEGAKVVIFVDAVGVKTAPNEEREEPYTIENAIRAYAARNGSPGALTANGSVLVGTASAAHCANDVLSRSVRDWQFSGSFREFERAFDRHVHGLDQAVEGETVGQKPRWTARCLRQSLRASRPARPGKSGLPRSSNSRPWS